MHGVRRAPSAMPEIAMMEFASEIQRPRRSTTTIITAAILAVAAAALFFYVRYQRHVRPEPSGPVVVPGMLRSGNTNFEYYKQKIRIEDPRASLGITFSKTRVAFISGIIVNDGDRKLEALELKITLFDLYHKLSKERVATPLRPGIGLYKPMEPLERRSFSVGVEAVEQLWDPKHVEIEITGLKYQ
jgi:hypothetical protein